MLLTSSGHFLFLAAKKKCEFVQTAVEERPKSSKIAKVTILERNKEDGNAENYSTLLSEVESCREGLEDEKEKVKVGVFGKELEGNKATKNPIVIGWQDQIEAASETVETVDITTALGFVMMVKDETELDCMKKSSVLSNKVLKHFFIPRLEKIIDEEEQVTHEALAESVDATISEPSQINLNVPSDIVRSAYYPIIQSGGDYDIRLSAASSEKKVKYDIITVSFGASYQNYCSNVARTFLIDPPKEVSDTYEVLIAVHDACQRAMRPGAPLKAVYAAAITKLQDERRKDLIKKLPKNLGFSIGIDFRDSALTLSQKNNAKFQVGMTFNLSIGFSGVQLSSKTKASIPDESSVSVCLIFYFFFAVRFCIL